MRTITSPSEIDILFKGGKRATHPLLTVLVAPTPEGRPTGGRMLFVAGRKLGGAVVRNRCKRVLREVCRRAGGPWAGHDVALLARAGIATAPRADVEKALGILLSRLGVSPA